MDLTPEPERFKIGPCDWTTHPNVDVGPDTQFCIRCGRVRFPSSEDRPCRVLRELAAAYRAGREDAAKAIEAERDRWESLGYDDSGAWVAAVRLARGQHTQDGGER